MQLEERQQIVEDLYRKMHKGVFWLCSRYIKNLQEREEVVQEIFLNCFRYLDKFESRSKIETWLYSIATRHCLNHIRAVMSKKRKGFSVELSDFNGPTIGATQLDKLIERQAMAKLASVCDNATDREFKCIQCFLLAHQEGLSYVEIADRMGTTTSSVRSRIVRGKELLKKKLRKHGSIV